MRFARKRHLFFLFQGTVQKSSQSELIPEYKLLSGPVSGASFASQSTVESVSLGADNDSRSLSATFTATLRAATSYFSSAILGGISVSLKPDGLWFGVRGSRASLPNSAIFVTAHRNGQMSLL